ncbi:MAG: Undecaprenyl-phosphate 4-deoxy-4-formamido-L-arabinose transferase [Candidatus Omnitrophica bacterium]|nr:Undecaprenyl-phosphate 4-deoxy-4-formamido-L-arabinose transferase [Candidatus Omnitrophota bacterium]
MSTHPSPEISVIVPVYDEEGNLPRLLEETGSALDRTGRPYEIILVDDGSRDGSARLIVEASRRDPRVRLVALRRNFGQTAALQAGFDQAYGSILVTMDADLQNDPADIPMLVAKLEEGYDLVTGWRRRRRDSFLRNLASSMANSLISRLTRVRVHDSGCTLKAYRREVVQELRLYGEMHRFIPALASWAGIRLLEVPVNHRPRLHGRSKYGFSRIVRVLLDMITVKFLLSYSTSPIQMFGKLGILSGIFGALLFVVAVVLKFTQARTLTGNPLFYLFILCEIIGIQFILIGLLAEITIRTYHESQRKKIYVLKPGP